MTAMSPAITIKIVEVFVCSSPVIAAVAAAAAAMEAFMTGDALFFLLFADAGADADAELFFGLFAAVVAVAAAADAGACACAATAGGSVDDILLIF
jgi:hypothetical protein